MNDYDYEPKLYNFIVNQIKPREGLKPLSHLYGEYNAQFFKDYGEKHFNIKGFSLEEWTYAYDWAIADVFNGGCEFETF